MFIDVACAQKKKYNQNAYGDYFTSTRFPNMNRVVAVLSDGLGSGIKANILACMTSTMLLKFLESNSDIENSCEIIMNSLPGSVLKQTAQPFPSLCRWKMLKS